MEKIISAHNLSVSLSGHRVLDDLSFTVQKGETVAIIGPNGAGKTTLLKTLLGFIPYEGTITVLGKSPVALHTPPAKIGYVPQRLEFDRTMPVTVKELLSIHLLQPDQQQIPKALALVAAQPLAGRRLGVLSGGEFQRVLVALALLNKPEVLFLDEPAAGIDMEGADEVYKIIKDLQQAQGLTIVIVSHDVDVVFRYATTVLCVNHRLVCSGVPIEALTKETLEQLYGAHHTVYPHNEKDHA